MSPASVSGQAREQVVQDLHDTHSRSAVTHPPGPVAGRPGWHTGGTEASVRAQAACQLRLPHATASALVLDDVTSIPAGTLTLAIVVAVHCDFPARDVSPRNESWKCLLIDLVLGNSCLLEISST